MDDDDAVIIVVLACVTVVHQMIMQEEMDCIFPRILRGCIGVGDVKEFQIEKPKDSMKERQSWSGKKKSIVIRCSVFTFGFA